MFSLKNYSVNAAVLICAVLLDFILGDPYSFPHPVKLIGKIITQEEKCARAVCSSSPLCLKASGFFIAIFNTIFSFCSIFFLLKFLKEYKTLYFCVSVWICYTCIAARCMHKEAVNVLHSFNEGIKAARKQVSNIVGRDTEHLDEEGVIRACVETVAESTGDGVIAPLFFIMIFGAAGGIAYKTVNTMDSMLGYKNKKYYDLGFFPAKLDDVANYIPARLCAFFMLLSAIFPFKSGYNLKNGFKIWLRDCRKHASPNSAHPESAAAGLLGLRLGGPAYYGGILEDKPYIGDELKKIEKTDILRCVILMYSSQGLFIVLYTAFVLCCNCV